MVIQVDESVAWLNSRPRSFLTSNQAQNARLTDCSNGESKVPPLVDIHAILEWAFEFGCGQQIPASLRFQDKVYGIFKKYFNT